MKSIASINTELPTVPDFMGYMSGESLRDYDIAIFNPRLPYLERIDFSGGGSCFTIEATRRLRAAITHWAAEIRSALEAGKTVFCLLDQWQEDSGAVGVDLGARGQRNYTTASLNNYQALPIQLALKNTKGRYIAVADKAYKPLLEVIKPFASYRVILEKRLGHAIFSTKDGAVVSSIVKPAEQSGHLVLLPYFDLVEFDRDSGDNWSAKATQVSHALVAQLVAIDKALRTEASSTPAPPWVSGVQTPKGLKAIDAAVETIDREISELLSRKDERIAEREGLLSFSRLLYESGKALEAAIEEGLRVLGFSVENFREGDFEIDHVIVGPSGIRLIGESEGKDTSAIDISKFRQLESNINEDFQREDVLEPAKGVLFGNGFRFTQPKDRAEQFTSKCLTNAKRLRTALVRTSDLYEAVIYALDHPEEEDFRAACRHAIESTHGEVVVFPKEGKGIKPQLVKA